MDYSQKNYQDFAVVVQPGIRDGTADNTPIDFMSDVSILKEIYVTLCVGF